MRVCENAPLHGTWLVHYRSWPPRVCILLVKPHLRAISKAYVSNHAVVPRSFSVSTRKGSGTGMSQRLRRAAEDLKRMQTEYKELQTQVYGRREERPSAPPEANAQPTDDHTGEEVGRFSYHTTSRSPYHRPSSFQHGHRNLRHDDTNYFEKKQQSSPDFQGGGRKHGEKWETDKEQTVKSSPIPLSSSGEETKNSPDAARYEASTAACGGLFVCGLYDQNDCSRLSRTTA